MCRFVRTEPTCPGSNKSSFLFLTPHTPRQDSDPGLDGPFSRFHSQPNCHVLKIEMLGGKNARRVCSRHTGLVPWVFRGSAALQPDCSSQCSRSAIEPHRCITLKEEIKDHSANVLNRFFSSRLVFLWDHGLSLRQAVSTGNVAFLHALFISVYACSFCKTCGSG